MSQTSFSNSIPAYSFEGQLADAGNSEKVSGLAEVAIPLGKFLIRGTDKDNQVKLPGLATDITALTSVAGVSLHDQAREGGPAGAVAGAIAAIGSAVSVLKKGRVVVLAEETCVAGDPVFVRYAAGGSGVGSFGKTAGSTERALLAQAVWVKGATAAGLGVIEINLPA